VDKKVVDGRTVTRVNALDGEERVSELGEMFGADLGAGRIQAETLLRRAGELAGR
jgi:DNA repair ATPase RecN